MEDGAGRMLCCRDEQAWLLGLPVSGSGAVVDTLNSEIKTPFETGMFETSCLTCCCA